MLAVDALVSQIEEGVDPLRRGMGALGGPRTRVASDPVLFGSAEHLLVVARKPSWRAALRRLARGLDAAGIPYKIVGSTCLALHGVPVTPHDIDVETDARRLSHSGSLA